MLLCLHRGALQVWVLGPATQSTGVTSGKSSWVSQVSNSSALLMSGSGINMGWALLVDLCTHFKCELIQSLEMAKSRIWTSYYYHLKKKKKLWCYDPGANIPIDWWVPCLSCICSLNGKIVYLGSRGILSWCQDSGEVHVISDSLMWNNPERGSKILRESKLDRGLRKHDLWRTC